LVLGTWYLGLGIWSLATSNFPLSLTHKTPNKHLPKNEKTFSLPGIAIAHSGSRKQQTKRFGYGIKNGFYQAGNHGQSD
jgi:hypothetical protein